MYEYRAKVLRVVDGDTLHLDVDLGCDTHIRMTVRLHGVDCPERVTEAGLAATSFVLLWLDEHAGDTRQVVLYTTKDKREKYGRYLGEIYASGHCLNQDLIDNGHATRKDY